MEEISPKEVIKKAEEYMVNVFGKPKSSLQLEEVIFTHDTNEWSVTFSYSELSKDESSVASYVRIINGNYIKRYKIVTMDKYGKFISIKKHNID